MSPRSDTPSANSRGHFSGSLAPTKELFSIAALVFLADFFGWSRARRPPKPTSFAPTSRPRPEPRTRRHGLCTHRRTLSRRLFRGGRPRLRTSRTLPTGSCAPLDLDVSTNGSARPTSSQMATFGRTSSWPWRSSGSLTQLEAARLRRLHPHCGRPPPALPAGASQACYACNARTPECPVVSKPLKTSTSLIKHYARVHPTTRSDRQRQGHGHDLRPAVQMGDEVVVRAKTSGDCMQNPSTPTPLTATRPATRCKSPGLRAGQRSATDHPCCTSACESDAAAVVPS